MKRQLWSILLAGGEGKRLAGVTLDEEGHHLPKQFLSLDPRLTPQRPGARSLQGPSPGTTLLGKALLRSAAIAPPHRTLPVVLESHRQWWTPELRHLPDENVAVQPANRGTGAAVLLPLLSILEQDPEASVVVFPCDHFVEQESVLRHTLRDTLAVAGDRLVLLGARPRATDAELGWICPQRAAAEPVPISTFVEKPDPHAVERLRRKGALVNTLILTGPAAALLDLYRESAPDVLELLGGDPREPRLPSADALGSAYAAMEDLDFSRGLLEPAARRERLWVATLPACGWSDLGTKERLQSVRWQLAHPIVAPAEHRDPELWRFSPDYWLG